MSPRFPCLCTKNLGNYKSFWETYMVRVVITLITISFITLWLYKCSFTYVLINMLTIHTCLQPLWMYVAFSFQCSLSRAKRSPNYEVHPSPRMWLCFFFVFLLFFFFKKKLLLLIFFISRYGVCISSDFSEGLFLNYIIVFAVNIYAYFFFFDKLYAYFPVYSLPTVFIYR